MKKIDNINFLLEKTDTVDLEVEFRSQKIKVKAKVYDKLAIYKVDKFYNIIYLPLNKPVNAYYRKLSEYIDLVNYINSNFKSDINPKVEYENIIQLVTTYNNIVAKNKFLKIYLDKYKDTNPSKIKLEWSNGKFILNGVTGLMEISNYDSIVDLRYYTGTVDGDEIVNKFNNILKTLSYPVCIGILDDKSNSMGIAVGIVKI